MASGLIENDNSEYQQLANILTNTPRTISVIVEDEYDIPFWNDLLNHNPFGLRFKISPYEWNSGSGHYDLRTGKANILTQSYTLGTYKIACLDSDYDYVSANSSAGQQISNSPYILQTYTYSVENYNCHATTLKDLCIKATCQMIDFETEEFVTAYSRIIHPLLVWSIWLFDKGIHDFTFSKFHTCVNFENDIKEDNKQVSLLKVEEKVKTKIQHLIATYGSEKEIAAFSEMLKHQYHCTEENAYLFMNGHILQNNLVDNFLFPYCRNVKNSHINKLCSSANTEQERASRMKHYQEMTQRSVQVLIASNFDYPKDVFPYDLLRQDRDKLLEELNRTI